MKLGNDVNLGELSVLCDNFTGADIKSVVCDALLKGFHRVNDKLDKNPKKKKNDNDDDLVRGSIEIERRDFLSSIESIKQSINTSERLKFKKMSAFLDNIQSSNFSKTIFFSFKRYDNWNESKTFSDKSQMEQKTKATLA